MKWITTSDQKINPLGGCLPILDQIPVFIALYWVLLESVELRQASFIGWLDDLSLHDPYFVLPVLMGVTMLIQQRLNPTPPDPMQAQDHDGATVRLHVLLPLLSVRTRPLLVRQQHVVDHSAMGDHEENRRRKVTYRPGPPAGAGR